MITKNELRYIDQFEKSKSLVEQRAIISKLRQNSDCLKTQRAQMSMDDIGGLVSERVNFKSIFEARDRIEDLQEEISGIVKEKDLMKNKI